MTENENPDRLFRLKDAAIPAPDVSARQRASEAALAAFTAANSQKSTQGSSLAARLKSIVSALKGNRIMDLRLPLGTAAAALIILPLGLQLMNSTAPLLDFDLGPGDEMIAETPSQDIEIAAPPSAPVQQQRAADPVPPPPSEAPQQAEALGEIAPAPMADAEAPMTTMRVAPDEAAGMEPSFAPTLAITTDQSAALAEPSGDQFTDFSEQRLRAVADEPVSTFSIDVDTASYAYVRRLLEQGIVPAPEAVRIEELINYFPYEYPAPTTAETPFEPTVALYPTPWNPQTQLLHIGIKGYEPAIADARPSNLVFLIDTSGSMDEPDKLPLLKRAFRLLVEQLSVNDTIAIVAYAGAAGIVLEPTQASEKAKILAAIDTLAAGGSTAGAQGIELAYDLAEQSLIADGINRVILATDGDFNVGLSDPTALEKYIAQKRDSGVFLSVLGFGAGNLGDDTMQSLAQNGNGTASYIADFREAQKVLVEEIGGTLETIARDVKIQLEFNPALISEYRLIGYETRALNREDFNNDAVDAGDIGAGHTVTAIYEVTPTGTSGLIDPLRYGPEPAATASSDAEFAFLRIRYKLPDSDVSQLIETPVTPEVQYANIADLPPDLRFAAAVAGFGQKLKTSVYSGDITWPALRTLAAGALGPDSGGYRSEFLGLIGIAESLDPDAACATPKDSGTCR